MKVITESSGLKDVVFKNTVLTMGVFDGVHAGHQKVIRCLVEVKEIEGAAVSILLTFDRHPLNVTHPEMVPPLLTTLEEKVSLLKQMGVDIVVIKKFSRYTAETDYRTFISSVLVGRFGMKHLVVGYDFHLGHGREGSQEQLLDEGRRSGFGVTIVPPVVLGGRVVSSTKIRRAVTNRRLERAAKFLARPYFFDADVIRGRGFGRELEFPTANVAVPHGEKLLPPGGVYAVQVEVENRLYGGMMNVGNAPTFNGDAVGGIEVHMFDFSGDIYGERIRIHCHKFIREEIKFDRPDKLRAQLKQDREKITLVLEKKR